MQTRCGQYLAEKQTSCIHDLVKMREAVLVLACCACAIVARAVNSTQVDE